MTPARSTARRSGIAFVGLGATAVAVLAALQGQLADLHLNPSVKVLVSLLIATIGAAVTAWQGVVGRGQEEADRARALDAALAGGATRTAAERDGLDLGVAPGAEARAEYRRRSQDAEIEEAMRTTWLVCVAGPPGAGKTRAAFEALGRVRPGAKVISPVGAAGLKALLDGRAQLLRAIADRSEQTARAAAGAAGVGRLVGAGAAWARRLLGTGGEVAAVLWLDGLERFLADLDVDAVARFAGESAADQAGSPETRSALRVVATIRNADLDRLLAGTDDAAQTARRLLSAARIIRLPPRTGQAAAGGGQPQAEAIAAPSGPPHEDELRPRRPDIAVVIGLALVSLGLAVWLARTVDGHGWTVPPPLSDQSSAIEASLPACQTSSAPLAAAGMRDGTDWALPIQSCKGSDLLSLYTVKYGRLVRVLTLTPASPAPVWTFTCLPGKSCALSLDGQRPIFVGAFVNPQHRALPVVVYRDAQRRPQATSPSLPPAASNARLLTLALAPGSLAVPAGDAPPACRGTDELCGYPADFLASVPIDAPRGFLLIEAFVTSGSVQAPQTLATRAYAFTYDGSRLIPDPRACLLFAAGLSRDTVLRPRPKITIPELMRQTWQPTSSVDVIC